MFTAENAQRCLYTAHGRSYHRCGRLVRNHDGRRDTCLSERGTEKVYLEGSQIKVKRRIRRLKYDL